MSSFVYIADVQLSEILSCSLAQLTIIKIEPPYNPLFFSKVNTHSLGLGVRDEVSMGWVFCWKRSIEL